MRTDQLDQPAGITAKQRIISGICVILSVLVLLLASCGGGGGDDPPAPPTALERAEALRAAGESAATCSATLMQEFTLQEEECVTVLDDAGYTEIDIGEALRLHFGHSASESGQVLARGLGLTETECVSVLNAVGYGPTEIGHMLVQDYSHKAPEAATILDDAKCSIEFINTALRETYGLTAPQVETLMEDTLRYRQDEYLGITAMEYVEKFSPVLKFDQAASSFPMDAQKWFEEMLCGQNGGPPLNIPGDPNSGYDYVSCQNQNIGWGNGLLSNITNGSQSVSTLEDHGYKVPTYFQIRKCGNGDQLRILYWWFYGYQQNAILDFGEQDHPADWEHIMVTTSEDREVVAAVTYYQHSGRYTKIVGSGAPNFPVDAGHPVVYVGKTAHGSYHNSGGSGTALYWEDWRNPSATSVWHTKDTPLLNLDSDDQSWMSFDRTADFKWGYESVGTHPTVKSVDRCSVKACDSRDTVLKDIGAALGCWDGYSDCMTGDTWCGGFLCASNEWNCFILNTYNKDYIIPVSDYNIIDR